MSSPESDDLDVRPYVVDHPVGERVSFLCGGVFLTDNDGDVLSFGQDQANHDWARRLEAVRAERTGLTDAQTGVAAAEGQE